ncbi:hypothetical protein F5Y04DRAFT_248645 [Hypomontagnella monticulosa]|nr:hypothetical protein F5Y04DRAFT_248645 [Hypomontagnella monticulosa]
MARFNEAQMAIIEEYWNIWRMCSGPSRKFSRAAAVRCWKVGPRVTSQDIGQYFSNRAAREAGRPRARPPTPEQLEILKDNFLDEPFPPTGTLILLTYQTGLEPKQVKQWFDYQRKKYRNDGILLVTRSANQQNPVTAAKMWRAFKKAPAEYTKSLWLGAIALDSGEPTGEPPGEGREEEWAEWEEHVRKRESNTVVS